MDDITYCDACHKILDDGYIKENIYVNKDLQILGYEHTLCFDCQSLPAIYPKLIRFILNLIKRSGDSNGKRISY